MGWFSAKLYSIAWTITRISLHELRNIPKFLTLALCTVQGYCAQLALCSRFEIHLRKYTMKNSLLLYIQFGPFGISTYISEFTETFFAVIVHYSSSRALAALPDERSEQWKTWSICCAWSISDQPRCCTHRTDQLYFLYCYNCLTIKTVELLSKVCLL